MMRQSRWVLVGSLVLAVGAQASVPTAEPGRVQEWLLAGSFPSPEPEQLLAKDDQADPVDLAPSVGDGIGETKWIKYSTPTGFVNFLDKEVGIPRLRTAGAMAMVYVYSPKMTPAKLLLGFSDGLAAYLNGVKAFQMPDRGGMQPDAHRAEVLLGEGWNRLYLKIVTYGRFRRSWGFTARLVGPDLKAIHGLKFSTENPFPDGKARMPKYTPFVSAYSLEHFGTHRIRLTNRTPLPLKDVRLVVRSRAGKELMRARLGELKGNSHVEADVEADEIFFQRNYPGATATVEHAGGALTTVIQRLVLPGTHSVEYKTDHIQRMRPWAGGRCAILLITPGLTRQSIELAQRGDFEWHVVDGFNERADEQLREELTLYGFDCIVIAGKSGGRRPWAWANVPGKTYLAKAIREGVGLVYVNPSGLTAPMEKVLGIAPGGAAQGRPARPSKLAKSADQPIVAGVPVEDLPAVGPYEYKFVESAKALVEAAGRPVVVASEQNGRRAVVLNLGRGAELIWPIPRDEFCTARLPSWERQWSLLLKSVIWASKKDTPLTVACSVPDQVTREQLEEDTKLSVALGGKTDAVRQIRVSFRSRGYDGPVRTLRADEVTLGSFQVPVPSGLLEAGENEVDVAVLGQDDAVLGWASGVFHIRPRASIGKITIDPAKDYYLRADELTFTVPGKSDVDGAVVRTQLADNRGRVVAERSQPVGKGPFSFTVKFKQDALLTPVARFQVELLCPPPAGKGQQPPCVEASAEKVYFVRQELVWDDYEPVLWLTRNSANWYYDLDYFRMLREVLWIPNGWAASYGPKSSAYYQMVFGGFNRVGMESLHFFSMNHNWIEQTFHLRRNNFNRTKDIRWLYRTPIDKATGKPVDQPDYSKLPYNNNPHNSYFPLDDPGYLAWTQRKIAWQLAGARRFNPIVYDLMDEGSYTTYARALDFDYSPVSLKHFRIWLKDQYGTLEALNAQWETDFKAWDDVMPMHIHQIRTRARRQERPNYSPWLDHRKYGDLVYNRYIKHCSESARRDDPDAVVGIGGGQRANPYGGWDYWLVANHFTWIENYFEETDEYIRSFNTPDRRLKACPGKDVWKSLSHGNCGFYRWVDYGHVAGDFSLLPRGVTTSKQLAEVRGRGFGKLFLRAEPVDDPIAIHYSQSTIHLCYALGRADQLGSGGPLNAKLGFYNLLEELGYQFKFVAYAQLAAGELTQRGYKLMILPESMSLSDREADRLVEFVEAGGVLLCDRMVGEWDEHGRARTQSVLEARFGLNPGEAGERKLGKGLVIHLATDFPVRYWSDRSSRDVTGYWTRMKQVLEKAGLAEPRARVMAFGKPARRTEIRYFRLGKIGYHVVRAEVPDEYEFVTETPGHVYDMRQRRYAGRTNRIEVSVDPSFPALVAVCPYKIQAVVAQADRAAVERGQSIRIAAKVQASTPPDVHALNFRVYGPDGKERRHYGTTLFGENGAATLTIPTALNEAKGKWTVKVSDLASGIAGETGFEIK